MNFSRSRINERCFIRGTPELKKTVPLQSANNTTNMSQVENVQHRIKDKLLRIFTMYVFGTMVGICDTYYVCMPDHAIDAKPQSI